MIYLSFYSEVYPGMRFWFFFFYTLIIHNDSGSLFMQTYFRPRAPCELFAFLIALCFCCSSCAACRTRGSLRLCRVALLCSPTDESPAQEMCFWKAWEGFWQEHLGIFLFSRSAALLQLCLKSQIYSCVFLENGLSRWHCSLGFLLQLPLLVVLQWGSMVR